MATEKLVRVFKDDDYSTFLLYQSGSFKKAVDHFDVTDKELMVQEIRDGILLTSSGPAILQLKDGIIQKDHKHCLVGMNVCTPDIIQRFCVDLHIFIEACLLC